MSKMVMFTTPEGPVWLYRPDWVFIRGDRKYVGFKGETDGWEVRESTWDVLRRIEEADAPSHTSRILTHQQFDAFADAYLVADGDHRTRFKAALATLGIAVEGDTE